MPAPRTRSGRCCFSTRHGWLTRGLTHPARCRPTRCEWASVRVTPASGTTACLGMLVAMYLALGSRRMRLGALAKPLAAAINTAAAGIDGRSARLRASSPGGLFANFHVVAEVPR